MDNFLTVSSSGDDDSVPEEVSAREGIDEDMVRTPQLGGLTGRAGDECFKKACNATSEHHAQQ